MKRSEEVSIIIEALSRADLIDTTRLNEARAIVKGALTEINCRKEESPKEIIEHILSEMELSQQVAGKNPFEFHASINGKPLFDNFSKTYTEKRISEIERKLELIKECVNSGKKINLFWDGVM